MHMTDGLLSQVYSHFGADFLNDKARLCQMRDQMTYHHISVNVSAPAMYR